MDELTDDQARFTALFRSTAPRVAGYIRRHVTTNEIDDVLGDTYLIAWRRRGRLDHDDPNPWLLVTARNVIANRGRRRREPRLSPTTSTNWLPRSHTARPPTAPSSTALRRWPPWPR